VGKIYLDAITKDRKEKACGVFDAHRETKGLLAIFSAKLEIGMPIILNKQHPSNQIKSNQIMS